MKKVIFLLILFTSISPALDAQKKVYEEKLSAGKVLLKAGSYSRALVEFNAAIQARPKEADAYYQSGLCFYYLGKYEDANEMYTKAIDLDDEHEDAYFERGYLNLVHFKDDPKAIADFEMAIKYDPKNASAWFNMGLSHYYLKDYITAITKFNKAIELSPTMAKPYYWRGQCSYQLKDDYSALEDYKKATELDPENKNALYQLGLTHYNVGDEESAIQIFKKYLILDRSYEYAYFYLALCQYNTFDYSGSIANNTRAIELKPTFKNAYYNRGLAYHYDGQYASAVKDFSTTFSLDAKDYEAIYKAGQSYFEMGDCKNASAAVDQALAVNPSYKDALELRVRINACLGAGGAGAAGGKSVKPKKRVPQIWAVVVGVSEYSDGNLNLQFADDDANSIAEFPKSPRGGGLTDENITLLTNEKATRANIIKALNDKFNQAFESDMIIMFIASHGAPDPNGNEVYFLTHDADKENLSGTALSQLDVEKIFSRSKAEQKLWIADACHSGGVGLSEGTRDVEEAKNAMINRLLFQRVLTGKGMAILTASSSTESSYENEEWGGGHGVFTYHFLEGLKGKADKNKNGMVEIREIYEYTYRNVAADTGGKQHPELRGKFDNDLPLSIVPEN